MSNTFFSRIWETVQGIWETVRGIWETTAIHPNKRSIQFRYIAMYTAHNFTHFPYDFWDTIHNFKYCIITCRWNEATTSIYNMPGTESFRTRAPSQPNEPNSELWNAAYRSGKLRYTMKRTRPLDHIEKKGARRDLVESERKWSAHHIEDVNASLPWKAHALYKRPSHP